MKSNKKYIGINQRVPFDVIDQAINDFLVNGQVDNDRIFKHMLEFTKGENRAKKAASYVIKILNSQSKLIHEFSKRIEKGFYLHLPEKERKVFVLCLISLTYPIMYELLVAIGKGLKAQDFVNKKFINEKIYTIFGSNRTVDVAIDAIIPMAIELNAIRRVKTSLYEKTQNINVTHQIISELVLLVDLKGSGTKTLLFDDLEFRPWFSFFNLDLDQLQKPSILKFQDGNFGRGYLSQ